MLVLSNKAFPRKMLNSYIMSNEMDCSQSITRIRERLPELERQILKFGDFFPLKLLPAGLFRDVTSGLDCIADIARDLDVITPKTSDAMVAYWSERLSRKIHVLVHICRTQQQHVKDRPKAVLDKMGTRTQWLEQIQTKQTQLSTQRAAVAATLETMQTGQDLPLIHALQKELQAIDAQLAELFR